MPDADTEAEKRALLEDPDWRARARRSWDEECNETAPFRNPEPIILELSDNGVGPVGTTLGEFAQAEGLHCSAALAEWMLRNGLGSTVRLPDWE